MNNGRLARPVDQPESVDSLLIPWRDIEHRGWQSILLGNGASLAIWDRFRYESLFEVACSTRTTSPLSEADRELFDLFGTKNFEQILSSLATAQHVNRILGSDLPMIAERRRTISNSLIAAVNSVHVPWTSVPKPTLEIIGAALRSYRTVFTTNYDLLVYWSLMEAPKEERLKDYFWDGTFDLADSGIASDARRVLYLHGALHLYRLPSGRTLKRTANTHNLLKLFKVPHEQGGIPLFITEGTPEDKLASIARSDYLNFAYGEFTRQTGSLVILGHSLSQADRHLVSAMRHWYPGRSIAISMRPGKAVDIILKKQALMDQLPNAKLLFFDASTHPLANLNLQIASE